MRVILGYPFFERLHIEINISISIFFLRSSGCLRLSLRYHSCDLIFKLHSTCPPVCIMIMRPYNSFPADGCATFKISKDPFSLCIYAAYLNVTKKKKSPQKRCTSFESHKQVLIDNTIPRNCTVMVTSAAKRSISHDLQWGHSVVREGTPNKTIISARFPHRSPTIHHCFIKIEKRASLYRATESSSARRSMADYSSCCGLSQAKSNPAAAWVSTDCCHIIGDIIAIVFMRWRLNPERLPPRKM